MNNVLDFLQPQCDAHHDAESVTVSSNCRDEVRAAKPEVVGAGVVVSNSDAPSVVAAARAPVPAAALDGAPLCGAAAVMGVHNVVATPLFSAACGGASFVAHGARSPSRRLEDGRETLAPRPVGASKFGLACAVDASAKSDAFVSADILVAASDDAGALKSDAPSVVPDASNLGAMSVVGDVPHVAEIGGPLSLLKSLVRPLVVFIPTPRVSFQIAPLPVLTIALFCYLNFPPLWMRSPPNSPPHFPRPWVMSWIVLMLFKLVLRVSECLAMRPLSRFVATFLNCVFYFLIFAPRLPALH
jgi:hypothetical protein